MATVEVGVIHVLGKMITPADGPQRLVSPPSTSLLFMENLAGSPLAHVCIYSLKDGMEYFMAPGGSTNVFGLVWIAGFFLLRLQTLCTDSFPCFCCSNYA